jgi:flagellar hook-basal body complex protein FliE
MIQNLPIHSPVNALQKINPAHALNPELVNEFNAVFKEAAAAIVHTSENNDKKQGKIPHDTISLHNVDRHYLAQQVNAGVVNAATQADPKSLNIVPLQIFLDNAIRSLERVSQQEIRANTLMNEFIKGNVSEDEVVLETAKLNLAISMVTTIVQSTVQTFKEIQQIPV